MTAVPSLRAPPPVAARSSAGGEPARCAARAQTTRHRTDVQCGSHASERRHGRRPWPYVRHGRRPVALRELT
jgi:hypothetical protein